MVQLLVRLGAPMDALGQHGQGGGWTPLCLAARSGAREVTQVLLSARANVHATSANGKTALEIAAINSKRRSGQAVLELLHMEMVASVLEIAFRHRSQAALAPPETPRLAPVTASLPPETTQLPPPIDVRADAWDGSPRSRAEEGYSLLHAAHVRCVPCAL